MDTAGEIRRGGVLGRGTERSPDREADLRAVEGQNRQRELLAE